jgi:FkbM family methyltransferase
MHVPKMLEARGLAGYQPNAMAVFLAAVEQFRSQPVFDIGANIGIFSMTAVACLDATVVGFEPTPAIADRFLALTRLNDLACRVEPMALGARTGTAMLHLSDRSDSSNSLRAGFRPTHQSVEVPVERLDDYCARTGLRPGVMKVDTESTEPDVLRGGLGLLGSDRPWIVCEVLAGRTETELAELLGPLGYRWYALGGEAVVTPTPELRGDASHVQLDWLFVPGSLPAGFADRARDWRHALERCVPG